jgi:pyridoxamine 5'-phosphate oxidase
MDKKEVLAFIKANPTSYFATIDGGKPRVRPIGTFSVDENGLIFSFQSDKDVYKQLMANPAVEVCYFSQGTTVRVSGNAEPVKDMAVKQEVLRQRPYYKAGIDKYGWDYTAVFALRHGRASVIEAKSPPGSPKSYVDL